MSKRTHKAKFWPRGELQHGAAFEAGAAALFAFIRQLERHEDVPDPIHIALVVRVNAARRDGTAEADRWRTAAAAYSEW